MGGEASNKPQSLRRQWWCLYGGRAAKPRRIAWPFLPLFQNLRGVIGWFGD